MFRPNVKFNPYFSVFYVACLLFAILQFGWTSMWLWCYFTHFIIFAFGVGFGIHRVTIHRSVEVKPIVQKISAFIGVLSNTGSPVTWGTSHYLHHAFPDTDKDPHTPVIYNLRLFLGFYNTESINKNYRRALHSLKPIVANKFNVFLHNYFYLIIFGYYALTFLFGGLKGLLFIGLIPSGLSYYGILCTNYLNHGDRGYRNFNTPDESANHLLMWFMTFGENWHNNHHHNPRSMSTREKWWEVDLVYIFCLMFDINTGLRVKIFFKKFLLRFKSKSEDYIY